MALRTWTGLGVGDLASTAGNWDTGVPIAGDGALFDDSASGACTWDIAAALLSISSGDFGSITVTQTVKATCTATFQFGQNWDTNAFDIQASSFQQTGFATFTWNASSVLILIGTSNGLIDSGTNIPTVELRKTSNGASTPAGSFSITNELRAIADGDQKFSIGAGTSLTINKIVTSGTGAFRTLFGNATGPAITLALTDVTGVNENADFQYVTVTGGPLVCNQATCSDLGNNTGVNFIMVAIVWDDGGVDSLWSTKENWVGDIAPTSADAVEFDATSGADATCDIAEVASVSIVAAYLGIVTQTVDLLCNGDFDITGQGAAEQWFTNDNDLNVEGDYSVELGGGGKGVDHDDGHTISVKGDVYINGGASGNNMASPFRIYGGILTPTAALTHDVSISGNNNIPIDYICGENQTMHMTSGVRVVTATFEDGTSVTSDGNTHTFQFNEGIVDPQKCTWAGFDINDITLLPQGLPFPPADYGNCKVFPQQTQTMSGEYKTIGDVILGSNGGAQDYTLDSTCKIICRDFTVGVGNTARTSIVLQETGSDVSASRDAYVLQDDTIGENKWVREDGSIASIGGLLTTEADSTLDWSAVTGNTDIGAFDFSGSSVVDYSTAGAEIHITGDGSLASSNGSNGNRNIYVVVNDGKFFNVSGNTYCDDVSGPVSGLGTLIGGGLLILTRWNNPDTLTVDSVVDGDLTITFAGSSIDPVDYGNATITGGVTTTTVSGAGHLKAWQWDAFRLTQNVQSYINISGSVSVTLQKYVQGNIPTRATIVNWDSSGTFICNDTFTLNDPNGTTVENQFEVADGAGPLHLRGDVDIQTIAEFNCLGGADIYLYADFDVQGAAVTDWGTSNLNIIEDAIQDIKLASNPHNVTEEKAAGSINYSDAWVASGDYSKRIQGAYAVTFLAAGAYGADSFNANRTAAISDATQATIDSSDGVSQFDFTVSTAGAIARNVDFSNMNLVGAIQQCSSESCSDTLNNNIYPPTDGLEFISAPTPVPAYSYGQYSRGVLGIGVGLASGSAYND